MLFDTSCVHHFDILMKIWVKLRLLTTGVIKTHPEYRLNMALNDSKIRVAKSRATSYKFSDSQGLYLMYPPAARGYDISAIASAVRKTVWSLVPIDGFTATARRFATVINSDTTRMGLNIG